MNSAWLAEFHRQWQRARGSRLREMVIAFSRDWGQLLRDAGVESAEDIRHSIREAETLAATGQVKLQRYRNRFIRRIQLPVTQEPWLRAQFASEAPSKLVGNSLAEVEKAKRKQHPLLRDLWTILCQHLTTAFSAGRTLRPFHWRQPEAVQALLSLLYDLTSREWPPYTLVRDACVVLGRETKAIERHQAALESALTLLFGRPMSLEGLGIITSNSRLLFDGPLSLEFADGSRHEAGNLRHGDFITAADLDRAVRVTTTAARILSVENSKSPFSNLAVQNTARSTLLIATSFPTQAVRTLLAKLPPELPHYHFGDTDPAGFLILHKLRQLGTRPVNSHLMLWREKTASPLLSAYDFRVLDHLLKIEEMADCWVQLNRMKASGQRGDFEQESLGPPFEDWPFYSQH